MRYLCLKCNIKKDEKYFLKNTRINKKLPIIRPCRTCKNKKRREREILKNNAPLVDELSPINGITYLCRRCGVIKNELGFYKKYISDNQFSLYHPCKKCRSTRRKKLLGVSLKNHAPTSPLLSKSPLLSMEIQAELEKSKHGIIKKIKAFLRRN